MDHSKSQAAFAEAKQYIPGGVNSPVRSFRLSLPKAAAANSPTSTATNISIMYFLTVLYF